MQKIENIITGPSLIKRTSNIRNGLIAKVTEIDTPVTIRHSFNIGSDIHLVFHEGCNRDVLTVYNNEKFGMSIQSSQRVAMGGNGAFLIINLYHLLQDEEAVQLARVTYVTKEGAGTFRDIILGSNDGALTFTFLDEFEEATKHINMFVRDVLKAVEW